MSLAASLKGLMRRVPQPVSIATVSVSHPSPHFHGATLSSLTSIALAPLPLVAFSIRLPSRLASALDPVVSSPTSDSNLSTPSSASTMSATIDASIGNSKTQPNVILHYLSSSQTDLASSFAKALPSPVDSSKLSRSPGSPMIPNPFNIHKHKLSHEGIPILQGCVGAISCRVLGSIKLSRTGLLEAGWDLGSLSRSVNHEGQNELDEKLGGGEASSELYVAEVIRMEDCGSPSTSSLSLATLSSSSAPLSSSSPSASTATQPSEKNDSDLGLPLVYHDQRYVSVGSIGRT